MRAVPTPTTTRDITVQAGSIRLAASLGLPSDARGLVVFAHGSGSSRHSPRNRFVAGELQKAHLATLLMDLLTEDEEALDEVSGALRFDIPFLARRLVAATDWCGRERTLSALRLAYFGASTGAAAALIAAAERPAIVHAVVSRGGRPDLAAERLGEVRAPTLLIVGGADPLVAELNQRALRALPASTEARLDVVPGATHLFEETGALETVAELAAAWFVRHLSSDAHAVHVGAGAHRNR